MSKEKKDLLQNEAKELVEELKAVNDKDKGIIIAGLKGMLLVADVNKKEKEQTA